MTAFAATLFVKLFTPCHLRFIVRSDADFSDPSVQIFLCFVDNDHCLHFRVVLATIFGAIQIVKLVALRRELVLFVVPSYAALFDPLFGVGQFFVTYFLARDGWLKPHVVVAAWNDVFFGSKGWDIQAVNHIAGFHRQLGWFVDQQVKFWIVGASTVVHRPAPFERLHTDFV